MAWITTSDVIAYLGVNAPADDDAQLMDATAAALAYCQRQRSDLDPATTPPADVLLAVKLYAAFLYRRKAYPQGLPGAMELGGPYDSADAMTEVYRLLGNRKPRLR